MRGQQQTRRTTSLPRPRRHVAPHDGCRRDRRVDSDRRRHLTTGSNDLRGGVDPSHHACSEVPGWAPTHPGTSVSLHPQTCEDHVSSSGCTPSTGSPRSCTSRTCILRGSWRSRRGCRAPSRWGRVGSVRSQDAPCSVSSMDGTGVLSSCVLTHRPGDPLPEGHGLRRRRRRSPSSWRSAARDGAAHASSPRGAPRRAAGAACARGPRGPSGTSPAPLPPCGARRSR